jgi:hypothetical protein
LSIATFEFVRIKVQRKIEEKLTRRRAQKAFIRLGVGLLRHAEFSKPRKRETKRRWDRHCKDSFLPFKAKRLVSRKW